MKYRSRYNWTHRDLLRKAHPKTYDKDMNDLFTWITKGEIPALASAGIVKPDGLRIIHGYEQAKTADVKMLPSLINDYGLTWEMIPPRGLTRRKFGQSWPGICPPLLSYGTWPP